MMMGDDDGGGNDDDVSHECGRKAECPTFALSKIWVF